MALPSLQNVPSNPQSDRTNPPRKGNPSHHPPPHQPRCPISLELMVSRLPSPHHHPCNRTPSTASFYNRIPPFRQGTTIVHPFEDGVQSTFIREDSGIDDRGTTTFPKNQFRGTLSRHGSLICEIRCGVNDFKWHWNHVLYHDIERYRSKSERDTSSRWALSV